MKVSLSLSAREAKRILFGLLAIEFIFVSAYVLMYLFSEQLPLDLLRIWFDMDGEANLPTWFSTIQLFVTGMVLWSIYWIQRDKAVLFPYHFLAASMVFVFLSADEAAGIHERVTSIAKRFQFDFILFKGGHGGWIAVYAVLALAISIPFIRTIRKVWLEYRHETILISIGIATFATGAVLLEILSYQFLRSDTVTLAYVLEVAAEEVMEMAGISIILYAALLLHTKISAAQGA